MFETSWEDFSGGVRLGKSNVSGWSMGITESTSSPPRPLTAKACQCFTPSKLRRFDNWYDRRFKPMAWQPTTRSSKKSWFATLLTINYRLAFDVAGKVTGDEKALTVKVTFTDYVSGKVLQEQRIFKPLRPRK